MFQIVVGGAASDKSSIPPSLRSVYESDRLRVAVAPGAVRLDVGLFEVFVCGRIDGRRSSQGDLVRMDRLESFFGDVLRVRGFGASFDELEGRFVILVIDRANHRCLTQTDRFGRAEAFIQRHRNGVAMAGTLTLLPWPIDASGFDPAAVAHALNLYSARPPKQHTFFRDVTRLGVGEAAVASAQGLDRVRRPFVPIETRPHGAQDHTRYADAFLDALRSRGSEQGNVVYLSSGWDSTAILAGLVHVFGASKVRAVIGRMTYSASAGICNPFEVERARKVADYFGVPLEMVEFDYVSSGDELFSQLRPIFQAGGFVGPTILNHWKLADYVARTTNGGEVAFAGEISDGAHNLGFSQYLTVFHPVIDFREYSDKMLSYLFGPTFLQALWDGSAEQDPVYQFLKSRLGSASFDALAPTSTGRTTQLLSSFFLRGTRFPLFSIGNSRLLTPQGQAMYVEEMERTYLQDAAAAVTPGTLYAWYLHLYNSFHWQAGTVATIDQTAEACGVPMALPFWDGRLQEFFAGMPESWGRGLEMKPTKYPLKQMLTDRIDYPMHLQVGPHSYQYDVNPRFTLTGESMHRSCLAGFFKGILSRGDYLDALAPDMFPIDNINRLVDRYVKGEEMFGAELGDVTALAYFAAYCDCR